MSTDMLRRLTNCRLLLLLLLLLLNRPTTQPMTSVGIDLKELGVQLPKCLKFCPGIEV